MAQRTENEETEFKVVPEAITLCVNCNVAGNCAAANNLCQKCLASSASTAAVAGSTSTVTGASTKHMNDVFSFRSNLPVRSSPDRNLYSAETSGDLDKVVGVLVKREVNRCSGCRRKVGLTGFRCRCGELFCAQHRYSDRHECSYDYKAAGRGAIARENPVVKAAKIFKI